MDFQDLYDDLLTWVRGHFFGIYRGVVTDNADSTNRGRLKVRVPSVLGTVETWAMPCVPYAGDGVGFYSLPEPGTGIWIEFEAGDPSFPVWVGCFWADSELPDSGGAPIKIWKTEKLTLRMDDDNDELKLATTSDSIVTMAADIRSESGGATHTVGSGSVISDSGKAGKVDVGGAGVVVNNGALEVK